MTTCPTNITAISCECNEPAQSSEARTYQAMAACDLASGKATVEKLDKIIEAYIMDEYYERCAGIKKAIELFKKFG